MAKKKSSGNPCAAAGGRRRCVKPGYRVAKKRKPSARNNCIKREMAGKSYGTRAAARKAFTAAAKKCASGGSTRSRKGGKKK